jgi:hypothetical protein
LNDSIFSKEILCLTQLTIKPSYLESEAHEVFQAITNLVTKAFHSEFVVHVFHVYFDKWNHLKQNGEANEINNSKESIREELKQIRVIFIDYACECVNGMSYHGGKGFTPIFINTYSLHEKCQKWKKSLTLKMISAFVFVVLLHELQHTLIRRLSILSEGEDSNPFKREGSDSGDGGYLFE